MENNTFNYNYSSARNKEVEKIRNKYIQREESRIERLRKLDSKVQCAGMIESLILGVIGALVFGIGMCFFLGVFSGASWLTLIFMIGGALLMVCAYPIYRMVSSRTKAVLVPQILSLSDEIVKS